MSKLLRRVPVSFWLGLAVLLVVWPLSRLHGASFLLLFGGAAAGWFWLYALCTLIPRQKLRRALQCVLLGALVLVLVLFIIAECLIFASAGGDLPAEATVAVVFGAGIEGDRPSLSLLRRLEAAYAWWQEDVSRVLIVSGGQGPGEDYTEAWVMRNWLVEHGVPEACIISEDRARDTEQNVSCSAPYLQQLLAPGDAVAAVSNEFHLYRCKFLLSRLGYEPLGVPAETPYLYLQITYSLREFCSVVFAWLGI